MKLMKIMKVLCNCTYHDSLKVFLVLLSKPSYSGKYTYFQSNIKEFHHYIFYTEHNISVRRLVRVAQLFTLETIDCVSLCFFPLVYQQTPNKNTLGLVWLVSVCSRINFCYGSIVQNIWPLPQKCRG